MRLLSFVSPISLGWVAATAVLLLSPASTSSQTQQYEQRSPLPADARSSPPPTNLLHVRTFNSTESDACDAIGAALDSGSSSKVYRPLSLEYGHYIKHYMTSSMQLPACVFLPTSASDLSKAIKIVGQRRVRFALSSGSHASNQGFSSTRGVHITLKGFQQVELSSDKSYIDVGPGNIWDNVYQVLDGSGVNVVGGRVTGVGVGGFITGGGGYSWKTQQHGLTVDTLIKADMVLPDGSLVTVSETENPDLFWAIKGGGNRFGVVYNFRLKTVSQTRQVYGGVRTYTSDQLDQVVNATYQFSKVNRDPKAQVIPTFNFVLGQPGVSLLGFYDADEVPTTALSAFDQGNVRSFSDGWKLQSFPDFVQSSPANLTGNQRGAFHTVSLQRYSLGLLNLIVDEMKKYGKLGLLHSGTFVSYDVEPFLPYSSKAKSSAWPHSTNALPLNIYFAWLNPLDDAFWHEAIQKTAKFITAAAISEGQKLDDLYLYPNYAVTGTDPVSIYGSQSLERLGQIKRKVDPEDVMGLTTYFDF